jgi:plasmid maintenance system antidote protein VapI
MSNRYEQMMQGQSPTVTTQPTNRYQRMMQGSDTTIPTQTIDIQPSRMEIGDYSSNDIIENDELYNVAKDYMDTRFNVDDVRGYSREELVNKALNNMRGFSGGNTVRAINELAFLNSLNPEDEDDLEKLNKIGKFYTMFEGMETLFGDTTASEKAEILMDYTRETLLDPVNLIGLGVGKFFASGGAKVATRLAQKKAMQIYKKNLIKGKSKETAKKQADKMWARVMRGAAKDEKNIAVQNRLKKDSAKGMKALATKQGLKEVAGVTLVDTVAGVGTALAYEEGLVRTTGREGNYFIAGTLGAIGSMAVGGSLGTASVLLSRPKKGKFVERVLDPFQVTKKTGDLALPATDVAPVQRVRNINRVTDSLSEHIRTMGGKNSWREKVNAGENLAVGDYGDTFFEEMLLGNSDKGLVGLAEVMYEQGFTYTPRYTGDKVSNFVADVIKEADPQDIKKFLGDFEEMTGITMYTSKEAGIDKKLRDFTPADFSKAFAYWASKRGEGLGAISRLSRIISGDRDVGETTFGEFTQSMFDTGLAQRKSAEKSSLFGGKLEGVDLAFGAEGIKAGQNRIVRMLVSAPGTSYLNLIGWGAATAINSATDVGMGLLFAGKAGGQALMRNPNAKESLRIAGAYYRANKQKVRNLLDPNMTYDAFKSISIKNPEAMRELIRVLPGGIEDIDKVVRQTGFNPNETIAGAGSEKLVEFAQRISFVKMQDVFTKSQEFIYQLDKNLDITYGKTFSEFFKDPNAARLMNEKKYKQAVARATYETQKAIFSLSYKDKTTIGELAGFVENFRNTPGVGLLAPFGRFFNNTVAFSMDTTGLSFLQKLASPTSQQRSAKELAIRGAIGWGFISTMIQDEQVYREQGLAPFQMIDPDTGAIKDKKFDFPSSHFRAGARILSYAIEGKRPPEGEVKQITDIVGINQLTRQLNQTVDGFGNSVNKVVSGDIGIIEGMANTFGGIVSQVVSGATRFLDPYNAVVGLGIRRDNYKHIDRKQGSKTVNNALRYMDQFIAATVGDLQQEKFSASIGDIKLDASKQLGYREVELTDTAKILNRIGRPNYLADKRTKIAVAGNRYNQIFHDQVEVLAGDLLRREAFKTGKIEGSKSTELEVRTKLVNNILEEARDITKSLMETGVESLNDMQLQKLLELENKFKLPKIDRALENLKTEFGEELEFKDLSNSQLQVLEDYLENNKMLDEYGMSF